MNQVLASTLLLAGLTVDLPASAQSTEPEVSAKSANVAAEIDTIPVNVPPESAATENAALPTANRFVEEIVVTAQKREENLQNVPISIQAFSADTLDAKGITTALDLPQVTPGLTYTALAGYSIVYIRGIGTDAFIPSADLSVPTYIDGIYFPFSSGLVQSFGALERIEVLKGPQGTLFGRNTTGGAISIITRSPGREFENSVQVSYAEYNQFKARVYSAVPLTDTFAFSISALYNKEQTYYKSLNQEIPDNFSKGARLKLNWTPTDDIDATLAGVVTSQGGPGTSLTQRVAVKPAVAVAGQRPNKNYEVNGDVPAIDDVRSSVIYGTVKLATDLFDLKLLGSTQDIKTHAQLDFDATPLPIASTNAPNGFGDIDTAEFQLLSNSSSWGADWLTYTAGLYYINSTAGYDPVKVQVGIFDADTLPAVGSLLGPFVNQTLDLIGDAGGIPVRPITADVQGIIDTESSAAYLQGTGAITDWLSLTLGGRLQKEKRALTTATVGVAGVDRKLITYAPRFVKSNDFSPKVSLDFRPADDVLLYVSAARGYKSGTYNIISLYTPPTFVKPEKVESYELGFKTQFFDNSLRLNGAIFENTTKNLQVQVISLTSGGAVQFENAGGARTRGGEFDLTWLPFADALPGLVISANGSYLKSIYTDFQDGSGFDETTGAFFGKTSLLLPGRDFTGNRVVRTPRKSGSVSPSYSFELGDGSVEIATDVYFNSGFFFSAQNTEVARQSSYHIINARLSYLYKPWDLRLTGFAQNLDDAKYFLYQFENDFGTSGMLAAPSVYGVRINWEF